MLRSLKSILGYTVGATDGDIGEIHDFLFDDDTWTIRYGVVSTGGWLLGRKVLLSPIAFQQQKWESQRIEVDLSKDKVKNSPDIDTDLPVSRHQRMLLDGYYGWSASLAAGGLFPVPYILSSIPEAEQEELDSLRDRADPHLRSAQEVIGYHVQASDGEIGHVDDFIMDDQRWAIAYLVLDTRNWLPGRKVLVLPKRSKNIQWDLRTVTVDLTHESLKTSPQYAPALLVNKEYETQLNDYYLRPKDSKIQKAK